MTKSKRRWIKTNTQNELPGIGFSTGLLSRPASHDWAEIVYFNNLSISASNEIIGRVDSRQNTRLSFALLLLHGGFIRRTVGLVKN